MKDLWVLIAFLVAVIGGCSTDPNSADCSKDADCGEGYVCVVENCIEKAGELTIESFTAFDLVVQPGQTTSLEWKTKFATSAQILMEDTLVYEIPITELAAGQFEVTVEATANYTLVASDGTTTTQASVTLEVTQEDPVISEFTATPATIVLGGSTRLAWKTSFATSGKIVDDSGQLVVTLDPVDLASGSLEVSPESSVRYQLLVENLNSNDAKEVGIEVLNADPQITLFAALKTSLTTGESTQLRWQVNNTESLIISQAGTKLLESADASGGIDVTPGETLTYTLTATNQQSTVSQDVVVEVFAPMVIDTFEATSASVIPGATTTLTWAISGDTTSFGIRDSQGNTIDLANQSSTAGAVEVAPSQTTTYILTASNPAQSVTATKTVTLLPAPPQINSFSSNVGLVAIGGTARLSWSIARATTIAIEDDLGNPVALSALSPVADSVTVTLTGPRTFTLTASNAGGQTTADVFVDAVTSVAITAFQTDVTEIAAAESVTLTWATTDATGITLNSSTGMIDVSTKLVSADSITLNPTQSTTYTLTAGGLTSSVTSTIAVLVRTPVVITTFAAAASIIDQGQQATLSWNAPGATSSELECTDDTTLVSTPVDISALAPTGGNVSVTLQSSSTCTMTVQGFRGPATASESITVNPTLPQVVAFSSSSDVIRLGESITLTWESADATALSLTDDQGTSVDITSNNVASDSIIFTPTRSATFTLAATNANGVDTAAVSIVAVDTENLLINEVFYDAVNADDGLEYVELYNSGQTFIDLQYFSLGAGGSSLASTVIQLSGVIPPGGCFVVGGPASTVDNGFAEFDLATLFPSPLQNGGTASDGIGLFFELAADVTSTSIPVDSVLYEGANTALLLGEDGQPDSEISPEAVGMSLHRTSISDVFEVGPMNAGTCFFLDTLSPSIASNQSNGTVSFAGWALNAALDQVTIGTQLMTCIDSAGGLECDVVASTDTGSVDITVTRVNTYTDDGSGNPVLTPVPLADQRSFVQTDGFLFENEIADSGTDFWCGITSADMAVAPGTDAIITAEVFVQGFTDVTGLLPATAVFEAVVVPTGNPPMTVFLPMVSTPQYDGAAGNNALYSFTTTSALPADTEVAFRYGDGIDYIWCDTAANGGSDDGYSTGSLISWQ